MKKVVEFNCLHKQEYAAPQMEVYHFESHQALMAGSFTEEFPEEGTNNIEFE